MFMVLNGMLGALLFCPYLGVVWEVLSLRNCEAAIRNQIHSS